MAKSGFIVLAVISVTIGVSYAATNAEVSAVRAVIRPILDGCGKAYGVTREHILAAKAEGNIYKLDPCYYACFFKNAGFMDSNGLFDARVTLEQNKRFFSNVEDLNKTAYIAQTCTSVNQHAVSDGNKGCERAALLIGCFLKENTEIYFTPFDV